MSEISKHTSLARQPNSGQVAAKPPRGMGKWREKGTEEVVETKLHKMDAVFPTTSSVPLIW